MPFLYLVLLLLSSKFSGPAFTSSFLPSCGEWGLNTWDSSMQAGISAYWCGKEIEPTYLSCKTTRCIYTSKSPYCCPFLLYLNIYIYNIHVYIFKNIYICTFLHPCAGTSYYLGLEIDIYIEYQRRSHPL